MENTVSKQSLSLRAFVTILGRMPANLVGTFLPGVLGGMETRRIMRAVAQLGGEWLFHDGATPVAVTFPASPEGDGILLAEEPWRLLRVLVHRSELPAFSHLLLVVDGDGDGERILILAPGDSPLLVASGLRLLKKHLCRSQGADATAFLKELEAVAAMIRQGNPLEALGGGE